MNIEDMAAGIPIEGEADIEGYDMIQIGGKARHIVHYGSFSGSAVAHYAMDDFIHENELILNDIILEEYASKPGIEPDTSKWLTHIYYLIK